jgi:hypothetical protein
MDPCLRRDDEIWEDFMKVMFKHLIAGYTGKMDDAVIYYNKYLNKVIIRKIGNIKLGAHHHTFKAITQNIYGLMPSQAYKDDLYRYAYELRKQKAHRYEGLIVWNNLYSKIMFAMAKANPLIDLKTITRQQIETDNLPCRTVKQAIEAGLLPPVRNYHNLVSVI